MFENKTAIPALTFPYIMPLLVAVWSTFWVHLCCETAHVSHELLEGYGAAARPPVIPPGAMNGVEVGSVGGSPVSRRRPASPPCLPWQFTLEPLTHLFSCFLLLSLPALSLLSFLSLPFFACAIACTIGSLISLALISMESKYSNKHVRLNTGLCRKRRSVSPCCLPSGLIHAGRSEGREHRRGHWGKMRSRPGLPMPESGFSDEFHPSLLHLYPAPPRGSLANCAESGRSLCPWFP